MGVQFPFTSGVSYLTASLHVRFRDTQHLLGIVLLLEFIWAPHCLQRGLRFRRGLQPYYRLKPPWFTSWKRTGCAAHGRDAGLEAAGLGGGALAVP